MHIKSAPVLILLRSTCLAAVLAAAGLLSADFWWHTHAWLYERGWDRVYIMGETEAAMVVVVPLLIVAAIQGATIFRRSLALDIVRAISLVGSIELLFDTYVEAELWWGLDKARGVVQGDFDAGFSAMISVPLAVLTLIALAISLWRSRILRKAKASP